MTEIRLQKVIASSGMTSRRKAEQLIESGRVSVNGDLVTVLGTKVDPLEDEILVDGELIVPVTKKRYLAFNKPRAVLVAASDPQGRTTIFDMLSKIASVQGVDRVFHVGRLDYMTEGLLLLTNDGDLANSLTHPSREVPRTYRVKVKGVLDKAALARLRSGITLEDGPACPTAARVVKRNRATVWLETTFTEGRNRLVRRIFAALGHPVLRLIRIKYGGVRLGNLRAGQARELTPGEIDVLKKWKPAKS